MEPERNYTNVLSIRVENSGVYVERCIKRDSEGKPICAQEAWLRVPQCTNINNIKVLDNGTTNSVHILDTDSHGTVGIIDRDFYYNGGLKASQKLVEEARETNTSIFLKTAKATLTQLIGNKAVLRK